MDDSVVIMVLAGASQSVLALCSGKQGNLTTNCREVSKAIAAGEVAVRLLLPSDQETGIGAVDRN
jgi:hypothetical protein